MHENSRPKRNSLDQMHFLCSKNNIASMLNYLIITKIHNNLRKISSWHSLLKERSPYHCYDLGCLIKHEEAEIMSRIKGYQDIRIEMHRQNEFGCNNNR